MAEDGGVTLLAQEPRPGGHGATRGELLVQNRGPSLFLIILFKSS
jgi:hypothetical protein